MPMTTVDARGWIGRPLPRHEDERFVTGTARFLDDLPFEDCLHAAFVRSPFAHGRIASIAVDDALRQPGVLGVFTARDFEGKIGEFPINPAEGADIVPVAHPILAVGRVRYVGEPVAVVVAESASAAADAAQWVALELEELPAVVEPSDALAAATVLHESAADNVVLRWARSAGPVDEAFRAALHIVRQRFRIPRLIASPLEPRGAV